MKSAWDHNVEGDAVGPVVRVSREEVLHVLHEMKTGKASLKLIAVSRGMAIQALAEICQSPI